MRVRVIDVEGTPEEIRAVPELLELLGAEDSKPAPASPPPPVQVSPEPEARAAPGFAESLDQFIDARAAGNVARAALVKQLVARLLDTSQVEVTLSRTKKSSVPFTRGRFGPLI